MVYPVDHVALRAPIFQNPGSFLQRFCDSRFLVISDTSNSLSDCSKNVKENLSIDNFSRERP